MVPASRVITRNPTGPSPVTTNPSLPRSRETAEVPWFTAEGVIGDPGARVIGGASRCGDRQWRGVAVVGSAVSRRPLAASVAAVVQRGVQAGDRRGV